MSDYTSKLSAFQANPNDTRPLPEIIADVEGFPLAYVDHEDGKRYYAIQDWILGVAMTDNPRRLWSDLKSRLKKSKNREVYESIVQLPYLAKNNRYYQMDYATAESLYQIAQRMDVNTGRRDQVLQFLARSGVTLDEMRIDPEQAIDAAIEAYRRMGRSDRWIAVRIQSKATRIRFVAAFRNSMRTEPQKWQYAVITDETRLGLWKCKTAEIKQQLNVKENDNLRDHQSSLAIAYESLAEEISAAKLEQKDHELYFGEAKRIVRSSAESVGKHAKETGQQLGIDIATGKPLLKDKS